MSENQATTIIADITIIGIAALSKLIKSIKTRGKTLDTDIHRAAVSCMHHLMKDGQKTPLIDLLYAMPMAARTKALIVWFNTHGPINVTKSSSKVAVEFNEEWKAEEFKMEAAASEPFWLLTPDIAIEQKTIAKALENLGKYLNQVAKKDTTVDEVMVRAIVNAAVDAADRVVATRDEAHEKALAIATEEDAATA